MVFQLISCSQEEKGGYATGSINGIITVTDPTDWANLKIGFFPGFGINTGLDRESIRHDGGNVEGFLIFSDIYDQTLHNLIPVKAKELTEISGLSQSYTFLLPSDPRPSGSGQTYANQLAVWIDSDNDDMLDLHDTGNTSLITKNGEFNRLPTKDIGEMSPVYIYNWLYVVDDDENLLDGLQYSGYKFDGYGMDKDSGRYTNFVAMTTAVYGNNGFDFVINP